MEYCNLYFTITRQVHNQGQHLHARYSVFSIFSSLYCTQLHSNLIHSQLFYLVQISVQGLVIITWIFPYIFTQQFFNMCALCLENKVASKLIPTFKVSLSPYTASSLFQHTKLPISTNFHASITYCSNIIKKPVLGPGTCIFQLGSASYRFQRSKSPLLPKFCTTLLFFQTNGSD